MWVCKISEKLSVKIMRGYSWRKKGKEGIRLGKFGGHILEFSFRYSLKGLEDVLMEDVKLEIRLMCCLLKPRPSAAFHRQEHRSGGGRGLRPQMMFRKTGQAVDLTGLARTRIAVEDPGH